MSELNIRIDTARLRKVKVGEVLGLIQKEFLPTRAVLSRFIIGADGNYLDEIAGLKAVDELSLEELYDAADRFWERTEETAIPEKSAPASG